MRLSSFRFLRGDAGWGSPALESRTYIPPSELELRVSDCS
jgi:hypothetical protein